MSDVRQSIDEDRFEEFVAEFYARMGREVPPLGKKNLSISFLRAYLSSEWWGLKIKGMQTQLDKQLLKYNRGCFLMFISQNAQRQKECTSWAAVSILIILGMFA